MEKMEKRYGDGDGDGDGARRRRPRLRGESPSSSEREEGRWLRGCSQRNSLASKLARPGAALQRGWRA